MLLPVTVDDVPEVPIEIPVIAPALEILEIVFPLTRFAVPPFPPPKLELIQVTELVPPTMLLMVL